MTNMRDVLLKQMHPDWHDMMGRIINSESFNEIWDALRMDSFHLAPKPYQVFRVLSKPPSHFRVIIIGQDPYINGEAHGLAFSSITKMTPSLRNIFREIARTEGKLRNNPTLEDWYEQGVFLVNTNLSTKLGKSLAHDHIGWKYVTGRILQHLVNNTISKPVIMAWGNHAKQMVKDYIPPTAIGMLLTHTHPAARFQEFTGNNHFTLANRYLAPNGIDWAGKDSTTVEQYGSSDLQAENSGGTHNNPGGTDQSA